MAIEQSAVDAGLRLTAIGMGTAFALLLFLSLLVAVIGRVLRSRRARPSDERAAAAGEPGPEQRDRALAAVAAVSALLARGDPTTGQSVASTDDAAVPDSAHVQV